MQLLGPIGRLYLSFQEIHSLVFKLCSNVLPDISKGPRVLGGPGCSLHVTPPGPQGSQWDFQDLLAPARADPCPPPQSLLHVAPPYPEGEEAQRGLWLSEQGFLPRPDQRCPVKAAAMFSCCKGLFKQETKEMSIMLER